MRVRMLATISGTRDGQDWPPRGHLIDLPDDEAAQHIANGTAEPAPDDDQADEDPDDDQGEGGKDDGKDPAEAETAIAPPAEAAEPAEAETSDAPEAETRRGRGRPKLPRDGEGNIVREG